MVAIYILVDFQNTFNDWVHFNAFVHLKKYFLPYKNADQIENTLSGIDFLYLKLLQNILLKKAWYKKILKISSLNFIKDKHPVKKKLHAERRKTLEQKWKLGLMPRNNMPIRHVTAGAAPYCYQFY